MSTRLVVCDDDFHISRAVEMKLSRGGFAVEALPDGQAAWEAMQRQWPALLVTDYQMPRLDGLGLIRRIRQHEVENGFNTSLPIVLLTAKGYELDEPALRQEFGRIQLFIKPFSPRELLLTVQAALTEAATSAATA